MPDTLRDRRWLLQLPLLLPLLTCLVSLLLWPALRLHPLSASMPWMPELGISFSLRADPLSWLFLAVIGLVASAVFIYGNAYLGNKPGAGRFWLSISLFYLAMLGIVVADDLILLFIFWELTSICSYMLISFYRHLGSSRQSALTALLVTGGGGLALLAGIALLGLEAGTYRISEILSQAETLQNSPLITPIVILFVLGAFTKSAQFPFHFWLPGAMSAPAPVSALLHSATMVKAGVFLLLRMNPLFADIEWYRLLLVAIGGFTMVYGALLSLTKRDLKGILANTTISGLGVLMMLIGVGTQLAMKGAMLFFLVHALYKSTLFMCTGIIDKCTGSRDITLLRGLKQDLPQVYYASLLAALSMGGIPLFIGFIGKEVIYEALLGGDYLASYSLLLALVTNAAIFTAGFVVTFRPFLGAKPDGLKVKTAAPGLWLPPLVLGVLGLITGIALPWLSTLLTPVAQQLMASDKALKLSLWHGFNLPLALSGATVLLGVLFWQQFARFQAVGDKLTELDHLTGSRLFERGLYGVINFAKRLTARVQSGKLRHYLRTMLFAATAMLALVFVIEGKQLTLDFSDLKLKDMFIGLLMVLSAVAAVVTRSKMAGALELGILGIAVTLFYAIYGGPDLAMTQVLVESLTVILFVLVVYKLPNSHTLSRQKGRVRDALVSVFVGAVMFVVTLKSFKISLHVPISEFYKEVSYLEAFGKNIVNVILVDFRALDTLGESLVLGLAAFGIFVLMKFGRTDAASAAPAALSKNNEVTP